MTAGAIADSASRMPRLAAAAAAILLIFGSLVLTDWVAEPTVRAIDDLLLPVLSFIAAWFCARAASATHGRIRSGWVAMAIALVGFAIGESIWCYYDLVLKEAPFPSPADGFFFVFPVGVFAALLFFRTPSSRQAQGQIILDGLIVAGSLFIVSWVLIMKQIYEAGAATRLEFVLLIGYPAADVVTLTVAAVVVLRARSGERLTMTLLGLGVVAMALADSAYAYLSAQDEYIAGNRIDLVWVAGLLLLTLAAASDRRPRFPDHPRGELPGWASFWFPYLPLMAAVGVAATQPLSVFASAPVLPVGVLLVASVLTRQALAVNENRRLLANVVDQALRDPLTGLANRTLFQDRLNHAMQLRQHVGTAVGVMILDLDDFKLINDTLGHPAGDELLNRIGERISENVRNGDTVARLGGDEFAVMIEGSTEQQDLIARNVLSAFDEPITVGGHELLVRLSVGLSVAPADTSEMSADELLKQADLAMYAAKRSPSGRLQTFTSAMVIADAVDTDGLNRHSGGAEAVQLIGELRRAVDHDELSLVYQPKFDLSTGRLVGVEALLRWHHPDRGLLNPGEFLPPVRHHQLMDSVTEFVVNRALDDAGRWCRLGLTVPVAINLSATWVAMPDLPERIQGALSRRGLDASMLAVEITEDLFLEDADRARGILLQLRERGIRVAIDDFGSGYSALWYLRDLPVDEVKLDRRFIAPIVTDPRAAAVVRAVIDLAHVLLLTVVAEGVEDEQTADLLRSYGCDVVQGFYYCPSVAAEEIIALVDSGAVPEPTGSS